MNLEYDKLRAIIESGDDDITKLNNIKQMLHEASPVKGQPVDAVIWVPVEMVEANNYNPNSVAKEEMKLLYISILKDGYTQPVVTIWDEKRQKYVIIDGFHRYFVCKTQKDIYDRNHGLLPIVVLKKNINERMASTVRHNRARGKHSINGMSNLVFKMLDGGMTEAEVCNEMGMEAEEINRLKHITGFSKLFENVEYQKAWETRNQLRLKQEYEKDPSLTAQELNRKIKE